MSKFWFVTVSFTEGSWSSLICSWHSDWTTDLTVRVRVPIGATDFSLLRNVQTGSGVHPASHQMGTGVRSDRLWGPSSLPSNGYRGSFSEIKRPEREVNHSPSSRAETENDWSYYLHSSWHKSFYFNTLLFKLSCDQRLFTNLFVWPVH